MPEIILINKPKGITSFDVIAILRKKLQIRKIGHAGTLDPLAEGLLIVGIGKGTKKLSNYVGLDKTYVFETLFGVKTTTGDMEGSVVKKKVIGKLSQKKLESVLKKLEGKIEMSVPLFSAIKINGKPLYKYARADQKVKIPKRISHIYYLKLINFTKSGKKFIARLETRCSSGTYVRSISEKIGEILKIPATTKSIKRIAIGDFKLEDAKKLDKI